MHKHYSSTRRGAFSFLSSRVFHQIYGWSVVALLAGACTSGTDSEPPTSNRGGSTARGGSANNSGGSSGTGNATTGGNGNTSGGTSNESGGTSSTTGGSTGTGGNNPTGGSSGSNSTGGTSVGGSASCGYKNQGTVLDVAPDIQVCLPPVQCIPETCPPGLGECVDNKCVFKDGYKGIATLPEAWATHYCDLKGGTCTGVCQFKTPLQNAQALSTKHSLPLCADASPGQKCIGIVASPPMMVGNREKWGIEDWGLGYTEASGLCYEVTGPGGTALLAVTDRCGGYCTCPSLKADEPNECGLCKEAVDLTPQCQCRGSAGSAVTNCSTTATCDWCAANNHPHFDVDEGTFQRVCGDEAFKGSCQLSKAKFVPCMDPAPTWPPELGVECGR